MLMGPRWREFHSGPGRGAGMKFTPAIYLLKNKYMVPHWSFSFLLNVFLMRFGSVLGLACVFHMFCLNIFEFWLLKFFMFGLFSSPEGPKRGVRNGGPYDPKPRGSTLTVVASLIRLHWRWPRLSGLSPISRASFAARCFCFFRRVHLWRQELHLGLRPPLLGDLRRCQR